MENPKALTFKQRIRSQLSFHYKSLYVESVVMLAWVIIQLISSIDIIKNYYFYTPLQITILVLTPFVALLFGAQLYFLFAVKINKQGLILFLVLAFFKTVLIGCAITNIIISLNQMQCGYFISHGGDVGGGTIVNDMQQLAIPSCSQMDNLVDKTITEELESISLFILTQECEGNQECISIDTLTVDKWINVFALQIASVVLGSVIEITLSLLIKSLYNRITEIYKKVREQALLKNKK